MRSMKSVAVFMEDGAFALFFVPTQGMIWQLKSPAPGNLPSKAIEINYYIRGSAQGEGEEGVLGQCSGAAGIDWCISTCSLYP